MALLIFPVTAQPQENLPEKIAKKQATHQRQTEVDQLLMSLLTGRHLRPATRNRSP